MAPSPAVTRYRMCMIFVVSWLWDSTWRVFQNDKCNLTWTLCMKWYLIQPYSACTSIIIFTLPIRKIRESPTYIFFPNHIPALTFVAQGSGLASYVASLIDTTLTWSDIAWLRWGNVKSLLLKWHIASYVLTPYSFWPLLMWYFCHTMLLICELSFLLGYLNTVLLWIRDPSIQLLFAFSPLHWSVLLYPFYWL